MVNLTGWGFGSEKAASVDVYSEQRFLMWPDDASDVPVVLWAFLPIPLTLMAIPKLPVLLLPPDIWEKVAQVHGKPSSRGSPCTACHLLRR